MTVENLVWVSLSVVGVINAIAFVIGYHRESGGAWRFYPVGRDLMLFIVALGLMFGMVLLSRTIGPLGVWPWVALLTILNALLVQRNWILFAYGWHVAPDLGTKEAQHAQDDEHREPTNQEAP